MILRLLCILSALLTVLSQPLGTEESTVDSRRHGNGGRTGGRGQHHAARTGGRHHKLHSLRHRNNGSSPLHAGHGTERWPGVLPTKSLYNGFPPPDDLRLWQIAVQLSNEGEQVLLNEVLKVIKSPDDLFLTDAPEFKWISNLADIKIGKENEVFENTAHEVFSGKDLSVLDKWDVDTHDRAPIAILGTRFFQRDRGHRRSEGGMTKWSPYGFQEVFEYKKRNLSRPIFSKKTVAIGSMDENWGWLSSHFTNRTVTWGFRFGHGDVFSSAYNDEEMKPILEEDNLLALFVNQHHNISHAKVISIPLGVADHYSTWFIMQKALKKQVRKRHLLFSAGSDFGFRPYIRACVEKNVGEEFFYFKEKKSVDEFNTALVASKMVLAMPGLGYDTYRLWEALAVGAVPVIEKGVGLDRTVYKLPVLLVEDYYDLTPKLLHQAYTEAIYRALRGEWEYQRMTLQWWKGLIFNISHSQSIDGLLEKHPMTGVVDLHFTRPLVPFKCRKSSAAEVQEDDAGCAVGTKRMPDPLKSCSIYLRNSIEEWKKYKWNWFYD